AIDHRQPRRRRVLQQEVVRNIEVSCVGEHWKQQRRREKSSIEVRPFGTNELDETPRRLLTKIAWHQVERKSAYVVGLARAQHVAVVIEKLATPRACDLATEVVVTVGVAAPIENTRDLGERCRRVREICSCDN